MADITGGAHDQLRRRTAPSIRAYESRREESTGSHRHSQIPDSRTHVDTYQNSVDFGPIAAEFERKAKEKIARDKKYKVQSGDIEAKAKYWIQWLRLHESGEPRWRTWWNTCFGQFFPTAKVQAPDMADLCKVVNHYFPPRSSVKMLVTDFMEDKSKTYEINVTEIHNYWQETPPDVKLRWIHAPLGLGILQSSIEDQFLHAGAERKKVRPFNHAGRIEWPYPVVEVLNFCDRTQFQNMRDTYHVSHGNKQLTEVLNQDCWTGFGPEAHMSKTGLLWDVKWRTTHLGLKPNKVGRHWETLPDFWTVCNSDIPSQLNEGTYKLSYGPLDTLQKKLWQSHHQSLHGHDFFGNAQLVRDPVRFFHRDGLLLTLSSMRGVNYLDRFFQSHLQEARGAIFENDLASAIAFVRKRFEHEGTQNWPEVSVEWFTTYLLTEVGVTPHADRQGYNAPSLNHAYQELILDFRQRRDKHFHLRNRKEPAQLIQQILICRDEIKRISYISKKRMRLFENLLLDVRAFENRANDGQANAHGHGRRTSLSPSFQTLDENETDRPGKLRSASELADWAVRKTALEVEAFESLHEEVCSILEEVYDLRSIQQREAGSITEAQNTALFALAVLSAIFIPFAALTGYYGMNLTGIRDSVWDQGDFWLVCGTILGAVALLAILTASLRYLNGAKNMRDKKARAEIELHTRKDEPAARSSLSDLEKGNESVSE